VLGGTAPAKQREEIDFLERVNQARYQRSGG